MIITCIDCAPILAPSHAAGKHETLKDYLVPNLSTHFICLLSTRRAGALQKCPFRSAHAPLADRAQVRQLPPTDLWQCRLRRALQIAPRPLRRFRQILAEVNGCARHFHSLDSALARKGPVALSVGAILQTFEFGKARPFPNIMKKFGRRSSRFGNLPLCAVDVHCSIRGSGPVRKALFTGGGPRRSPAVVGEGSLWPGIIESASASSIYDFHHHHRRRR